MEHVKRFDTMIKDAALVATARK